MSFLRNIAFICLFVYASAFSSGDISFEEKQKSFERVKIAYERKENLILTKCREAGISEDKFANIFIRVFKQEGVLEVWIQKPEGDYILFSEYKIFAHSGELGPKRQQGDYQVPEGYYYINDFNPASSYYLSLGINYPNDSDRKLSKAKKLGGDIYIHGGAVSAGCLAMSDYYIEEIYICAVKARNYGQDKIPVQIFPFVPSEKNMEYFVNAPEYKSNKKFWKNLYEGYYLFEKYNRLSEVSVSAIGSYQFAPDTTMQEEKQ